METLENQQVALLEVTDYRWWCGQIQTQLQLQMQLGGSPLWLDTWCRDVSAEQLLVSARWEKNRCSQENLSVLHLTLFLLEMAWAMSKEESNRKALTEGASCVTIWAQFSSSDTNDCFSILCKGILATAQVIIFLKHSNLLKVQIAFQNGSLASLRLFAETSSSFLDSQEKTIPKPKLLR